MFNGPCDVAVAENGDIFVADGHWNARIVKFSKDGRFIKAWGRKGTAPGEFDVPHTLVIDKRGRVLVGDRTNKRVQLFDQDGRFLDQWTHLGSPSGMFIAPDDTLFVVDYNDRKGIFIASAETGVAPPEAGRRGGRVGGGGRGRGDLRGRDGAGRDPHRARRRQPRSEVHPPAVSRLQPFSPSTKRTPACSASSRTALKPAVVSSDSMR